MKITKIKIDSFGALRDREFVLSEGINLVEGNNEAGKTSLAMFIKFIFYGLSGRASEHFPVGERKRFINWDTGRASGSLEFDTDEGSFRIERTAAYTGDGDAVRERKSVISLETSSTVKCAGEPGEMFFGVPESVFVNTVFVRQLGSNSIDNAEICSAIENILGSADEKISVKKVLGKLDFVRRQLMHKNAAGGEIPELEGEIAMLESELSRAEAQNASLISAKASLDDTVESIAKLERENTRLEKLTQICEDIYALRERDRLREAIKKQRNAADALAKAQADFPDEKLRHGISEVRAGLEQGRADLENAKERLAQLRENAVSDPLTAGDCDSAHSQANELFAKSKSRRTVGIVFIIFAVAAAVGLSFASIATGLSFAVPAAAGVILLAVAMIFLASASGAKKKLGILFDEWNVSSIGKLERVLSERKDQIYNTMLAQAQIESAEKELRAAADRIAGFDTKARDILRFLPSLGDTDADTMDCEEILVLCEKETERLAAKLSAQRDEVAAAGGECRSMAASLEKYDFSVIAMRETELSGTSEWEEAKSLESKEVERLYLRLKMNRDKLRIAYDKRTEYETILAEGRAVAKVPADIAEKLEAKRAVFEDKKLRLDAIRLAIDTLEESGERLRAELMPRIVKKASAMFSAATEGKYSSLGVSAAFDMTVSDGSDTRSADYLSAGSADAAYICLRLALAEVIFGKRSVPVIFDESFAKIDEGRLVRLFALQAAAGMQTVVFTCRRTEREIFDSAKLITL